MSSLSYLYLFFFLALFCTFLVICLNNIVYSVFSLILVFFSIFGILLSLNVCEFLAILILIVYIGAVAILFLFTLMMLGTLTVPKSFKKDSSYLYYREILIINFFVYFVIKSILFYHLTNWNFMSILSTLCNIKAPFNFIYEDCITISSFQNLIKFYSNDIFIFSHLLYTEYCLVFWLISLVLLLTLLGSLILSLGYYKPILKKNLIN